MNYYEAAYDSMGIYPKNMNGVPRTEWQDGWNEYGKALLDRVIQMEDYVKSLSKEHAKALETLIEDEVVNLSVQDDGSVKIWVNCNDFFMWGCADAEQCYPPDLEAIYKDHNIWLCKKRNMQPQKPVIEYLKKRGVWNDEFEKFPVNPDHATHSGRASSKKKDEVS